MGGRRFLVAEMSRIATDIRPRNTAVGDDRPPGSRVAKLQSPLPHQQRHLKLPFTDKPGEVTGVEGRVGAVTAGGHTPHRVPIPLA